MVLNDLMPIPKWLIQNKRQLRNKKTQNALDIIDAGLQAALPKNLLAGLVGKSKLLVGNKTYCLSKYRKVYVVAVGKAADSMAKAIYSKINPDGGIIVIPQNYTPLFHNKGFKVHRSGHPIPNASSVAAAKSILEL